MVIHASCLFSTFHSVIPLIPHPPLRIHDALVPPRIVYRLLPLSGSPFFHGFPPFPSLLLTFPPLSDEYRATFRPSTKLFPKTETSLYSNLPFRGFFNPSPHWSLSLHHPPSCCPCSYFLHFLHNGTPSQNPGPFHVGPSFIFSSAHSSPPLIEGYF